jgi:hypothetical protein
VLFVAALDEVDGSTTCTDKPSGHSPLPDVLTRLPFAFLSTLSSHQPHGTAPHRTALCSICLHRRSTAGSLYSIVAHAVNDLPHLQKSIGLVLVFVGLKMLLAEVGIEVG